MSALAFDTYAAVKKLQEVGFTEQQAEAQTRLLLEVITGELATKLDLEKVRAELKRDIEAVKLDLENVRAELKRDIETLRAELKRDMKELELRLTIKLGAMLALAVGAVAALVKLL